VLNNSSEEEQPGEALYIGMDFNVGKMAGIVHVLRLGLPHAVTEIINAYDTPDMIRIIKERFWLYADGDYRKVREIYIYRMPLVIPGSQTTPAKQILSSSDRPDLTSSLMMLTRR
jgi:hypothetical protein